MPFTSYNLLPDLLKAVKAMGFTSPTPIQVSDVKLCSRMPSNIRTGSPGQRPEPGAPATLTAPG